MFQWLSSIFSKFKTAINKVKGSLKFIIHLRAASDFVVWKKGGMGLVGFKVVNRLGGTSEVDIHFLRVPVK